MIEKVNITDSNVVELIRGKLPIATEIKNGCKNNMKSKAIPLINKRVFRI